MFNIAIANTDDHLRNHGFILSRKGWKLSPAFDLNPNPRGNSLTLAIDEINHHLDFDLVVSQANYYRLSHKEACAIKDEMLDKIAMWRDIATSLNIANHEIDQMQHAFKLQ